MSANGRIAAPPERAATTAEQPPLLARPSSTPWLALGLILAVYGTLAIGYATRTPIWQNPDEPAHYNYLVQVATTATLPELRAGDWDSALLERVKAGRLEPGDSIAAIRYESWQPPLYYVLAAPLVALFPDPAPPTAPANAPPATSVPGAQSGTPDPAATAPPTSSVANPRSPTLAPAAVADQPLSTAIARSPEAMAQDVLRLRLLGVLLGGLTLVAAYFVALQLLPQALALMVPAVMTGVPMFTAVAASVSADPLANLLAALLLLVLVQPRLRPLPTGVLLGLSASTKLALAIFAPVTLAAILLRSRRRGRDILIVTATAALLATPWLIHQVTTYGWTDPLASQRHAAVVADQPRFQGFTPEYLSEFATVSFHSFWAQFGWMAIPAPDRLYWIWGALSVLGVVGLLRTARALSTTNWLLMLLTVGLAALAYVAYNLAFQQFQGRYLFTALVPICALLVAGWAAWLPDRWRVPGTAALAVLLIALNGYVLTRVLPAGFAPT